MDPTWVERGNRIVWGPRAPPCAKVRWRVIRRDDRWGPGISHQAHRAMRSGRREWVADVWGPPWQWAQRCKGGWSPGSICRRRSQPNGSHRGEMLVVGRALVALGPTRILFFLSFYHFWFPFLFIIFESKFEFQICDELVLKFLSIWIE
jgi:hypothetical protein